MTEYHVYIKYDGEPKGTHVATIFNPMWFKEISKFFLSIVPPWHEVEIYKDGVELCYTTKGVKFE